MIDALREKSWVGRNSPGSEDLEEWLSPCLGSGDERQVRGRPLKAAVPVPREQGIAWVPVATEGGAIMLSGKVVRRLIREEGLSVIFVRMRMYRSYRGETATLSRNTSLSSPAVSMASS